MSFKFNPITGQLDLVGSGGSSSPQNFSYTFIAIGESVTIPFGQQMVYHGDLTVLGDLIILGSTFEIP